MWASPDPFISTSAGFRDELGYRILFRCIYLSTEGLSVFKLTIVPVYMLHDCNPGKEKKICECLSSGFMHAS